MRKDNSIYNKKQPGLYISKKNIFSLQLYKGDDTSNQQRNKLKDHRL